MAKGTEFPKRFLILGATSAIAMAVAGRVASRGGSLFLVARNPAKLDALSRDLLTRGAAAIGTAVADLDETAAHTGILASADRFLDGIDVALIAHGVLGNQEQAQIDASAAEAILRTNFVSPVSLITWLANYFVERGQGTLAVISSVAGDRGRKSNYVYGASKGGLNVFLDGVRNRIDRAGVQVLTIRPGFVDTPMTAHLAKGRLFSSPAKVADQILRAIERRKDIAYVPGFWAPIMFVIRIIPQSIFKKLNL